MTDVQVSVRLRRETGLDTSVIDSLGEVFFYNLLDKIETSSLCGIFLLIVCHLIVVILLILVYARTIPRGEDLMK